jgi:hypothetical protein
MQPQPGQQAWGNQAPGQPGLPQAQAQASTKNSNRPLIGVIVVMVLVLAGGGVWALTRGDDSASDRSSTDLQDALLTLDDVRSEFELDTGGDSDDDYGQPDVSPACREALAGVGAAEAADPNDAEVSFVGSDGARVTHTINWIDEDELTVAESLEVLSVCSTFSSYGPDGRTSATWGVGPFEDDYGDDAFWFNLTVRIMGLDGVSTATVYSWGVFWSRDDVVSAVMVDSGVDQQTGAGNPPEADFARELARTADQRLEGVL